MAVVLKLDVKLEGFDEFENHLTQMANGKLVESGFKSFVNRARDQAIEDNPVGDPEEDEHPGLMKKSWEKPKYEINGKNMSATVTNSVEYGMAENYGHYQQPGLYVPAINARLIHYWVPGTYALEASMDKISTHWESIVKPHVIRAWNNIRTDYYDDPFGELLYEPSTTPEEE